MTKNIINKLKALQNKDSEHYYMETELLQSLTKKQFQEFKKNLESDPEYEKIKDSFILDESERTVLYIFFTK